METRFDLWHRNFSLYSMTIDELENQLRARGFELTENARFRIKKMEKHLTLHIDKLAILRIK